MTRRADDGGAIVVADHEHIQRSKLRVDTRKWAMARMAPKRYGDRIMQEHTGADGGPIETRERSDDEKIAAARGILREAFEATSPHGAKTNGAANADG